MKKTPLLITVLAASLSFAGIEITGTRLYPSTQYTPTIIIKNTSQTEILQGIKMYAYFANEDLNAYYYFADMIGAGAYVQSMSVMNPRSPHVYRVEMDFGEVIIGPNTELPPINYFTVQSYDHRGHWRAFYNDPQFKDIVIESKDGRVLHSRHPDFKSRVGVLGRNCPSQFIDYKITMDTEDNNPETRFIGDIGFRGVEVFGRKKDVHFYFCAVDFHDLKPVPYDHVVLRMDENCPDGTYPFSRIHDTEDKNNINEVEGHGWPSVVDKDIRLEFCFVPASPNSKNKFPLDGDFEFFANVPNDPTIASTTLHIDDEDSNCKNNWDYYGKLNNTELRNRIHRIISGQGIMYTKDTDYKIIRKMRPLGKSAEVATPDAPVSGDNMVVVNTPAAAVLKGFDHSSVSFEIETAGNTKVTITNAKGATVAKIAKDNLEPGIHHVEWHSGIVPNGVYFVRIEHKGKTSANTVFLK